MSIYYNNNEVEFKVVSILTERRLDGNSIIEAEAFEDGEYQCSLSVTIKNKLLINKKRIRELLEDKYNEPMYRLLIKNKKATIKVGDTL